MSPDNKGCTFVDPETGRRCIKDRAHLTGHQFEYRKLTEADMADLGRMMEARGSSKRRAPYIAAVLLGVLFFHDAIGAVLTAVGNWLGNG